MDEKLDRIEQLMQQLGLLEPEEEEQAAQPEPVGAVKSKKTVKSEDELLASFEDLDLGQFKE